MARDADDVAKVLAYGRRTGIPVTFRAGGTSLNGQGQSDGILVDVRRHFGGVAVEDGGALRPGQAGHRARPRQPRPRPARPQARPRSRPAPTSPCVGGVIANNSGGMRCGVDQDSYSTVQLADLRAALGDDDRHRRPRRRRALRRRASPSWPPASPRSATRSAPTPSCSERIRRKFAIKNTTGYRLCAFLDADEPLEIFRRLLVGSEGTLAFVAEAVFETVPLPAKTTTAWVHFPGIDEAIAPVRDLVDGGATAVELMVAPALIIAAWNMVGAPRGVEGAAAGVGGAAGRVRRRRRGGPRRLRRQGGRDPRRPRDDPRRSSSPARPEEIELAWRVREGLHGLIGRLRLPGTALIVEDVCVPPERIAEGARDLQALLGEHGFLPGVAGHASAGNLHFMLTPDFAKPEDLERYEAFMAKLVELIVDKYDGSLKAEHGTGINMAPYRGARVGGEGDRADVAGQAARRPRRRARPRRRPQPRPRRPPAQPEDDPGDRGVGDDLRRVRLLRAGLPEPQPDHDAAPADRPAPRDGPPAGGLAAAAGAARGVRVRRRSRPAPPTAPASSPARSGSTRARWSRSCAGSGTPSAPNGRHWRRRSAGVRSRRSRALALRFGGPLARRTKRGRGAAGSRAVRAEGVTLADKSGECRGRVTPSAPNRGRRHLRPHLHQSHLRPRRRRAESRPGGDIRPVGPGFGGRGACRGFGAGRVAGLGPGRRVRVLLRAAVWSSKGFARRSRAIRRTRWSSGSGSGAERGSCRS